MTFLEQLDAVVQNNLDRHLQELMQLCAQPSISAQGVGMQACANLVRGMLSRRGFTTRLLPGKGYPVVFAERGGRSQGTLLFYNHYDVQPPEPLDEWDSPPFEPALRDGKLYARGVSDDKGHILCRLAAIDALLEMEGDLPCNIKFLIEGEEEIGSVNLPAVIQEHKDTLAADACLWEFGGVDKDGIPQQVAGLRGICYVELSVRTASRDAHSGLGGSIFPNAAWRLLWALHSLKGPDEHVRIPGFYDGIIPPTRTDLDLLAELPDPAPAYLEEYALPGFIKGLTGGDDLKREEIFSPTCTICGLTAGYQGPGSKTILPAAASAKVDFRLIPNQDPDRIVAALREHLDSEGFADVYIQPLGFNKPARTRLHDPFLRMVVDAARPIYGVPQQVIPMSGGSGPNHPFLHVLNVPVATAGIGYPGSQVHAPNENIRLDHFVNGVKHTALIMQEFGA